MSVDILSRSQKSQAGLDHQALRLLHCCLLWMAYIAVYCICVQSIKKEMVVKVRIVTVKTDAHNFLTKDWQPYTEESLVKNFANINFAFTWICMQTTFFRVQAYLETENEILLCCIGSSIVNLNERGPMSNCLQDSSNDIWLSERAFTSS